MLHTGRQYHWTISGRWVHNPFYLEGHQRFTTGHPITSGRKNVRIGYLTPSMWAVFNASNWRTKSAVPHTGVNWLHNPNRVGSPKCCRVRDEIKGLQVSALAT